MTKRKEAKVVKSESTILGQLSESINHTHVPEYGPVERFRISASTVEERIATRIRDFWKERGYHIKVEVYDLATPNKSGAPQSTYRAARSNLTCGLPPGCKELAFGIDPHSTPKSKRKEASYE